jgi:hypothetical protein
VHIQLKVIFSLNRLAKATGEEAMRLWVAVPGIVWILASIAALPQSALALTASQVY